ncbi:MAG: prevent-host-death family protein, partial [Paenibacillaceae bacterium]|nr:prevent-host-death family protein [Paenibacillaceae bacterium]
IIRPISDLRNHFNAISETCHKEAQPDFITKNGQGDLVAMSQAFLIDLYQKLAVADKEAADLNVVEMSHEDMMNKLRKRIHDKLSN